MRNKVIQKSKRNLLQNVNFGNSETVSDPLIGVGLGQKGNYLDLNKCQQFGTEQLGHTLSKNV